MVYWNLPRQLAAADDTGCIASGAHHLSSIAAVAIQFHGVSMETCTL